MSLVDDLLPHMRRVLAADRDLHDLSLLWQMIEASSAISCPEQAESILPTLSQTRSSFADLQQRLVQQLGQEHLAELGDELESIAQCTIDILVRNLFERTADVGFLATDDVLRAFCAASAEQRAGERAGLCARLAEYRDKYTVYDDIAVLGLDGQVLARLDNSCAVTQSADAIVDQALACQTYVERYAVTDLAADGRAALMYGHRIDDGNGRPIGVLVLRFRCVDELQRIFASVGDNRRQVAISLIDDDGRVLLSNDEAHVPLSARLETAADRVVAVTAFGGREYLSVTCATRGYQGYGGPGWRAQAMISLLTAFRGTAVTEERSQEVALENESLRQIQADVDAINRNLRRVVWNGRLVAGLRGGSQAQLKAVLGQVNAAGMRTQDRVATAIDDLYQTALGRARHQTRELARLAADIMDRNLYERANDCRWWALSPVLRRELARPADAAGSEAMNTVLRHINGLYTVYSRLVAFDAEGVIRGVSNDDPAVSLIGQKVDSALVQAVSSLPDSQRYAVSDFAPSPLSDGVPTYIYLAAVRAADGQRPVGGIAIVFNAEREFRAMLSDVLGERAGIAAFLDAEGRVLACTDPGWPVGAKLPFDIRRTIVEHGDAHMAVAGEVAAGYREFKRSDGYRNGVGAVVALRLGAIERRRQSMHDVVLRVHPSARREPGTELAMFEVGSSRCALPLQAVLEARTQRGLVRSPGGRGAFLGLLEVPSEQGPVVIPVLCARQLLGVNYPARAHDGAVLVLPAAPGQRHPAFGLRVDDVTTVLEVGDAFIKPVTGDLRGPGGLVDGIVRLAAGAPAASGAGAADSVLVQRISFEALRVCSGLAAQRESGSMELAA